MRGLWYSEALRITFDDIDEFVYFFFGLRFNETCLYKEKKSSFQKIIHSFVEVQQNAQKQYKMYL